MLIWLGKNRLGQVDRPESVVDERTTTQVTYIAQWGGRPPDELESPAGDEGVVERALDVY